MFEKMKFIASQAWVFLAPFIRLMMSQAGAILAKEAQAAVDKNDVLPVSGATKRAEAFDQVKGELAKQGITMASSVINAAIEAAVVKLKG